MLRLLVDFHGVLQTTSKYRDPKSGGISVYSQPVEGSQEAIRKLSSYYDIVLVSSMMPEGIVTVAKFMDFYFPEIEYTNWVFTFSKQLVCGDIMIDDNVSNLAITQCPIKILFGHASNTEYIHFNNWSKLTDYLIDIAVAYWESYTNETNTAT